MRAAYFIIGGLLIIAVALVTFVPSVGDYLMPMAQKARVTENGIEWPVKKTVRFYVPSEGMGTNELAPSYASPDAKTRCGTESACSLPSV